MSNQIVKQLAKLVKGCIANERSAQEALYKLFYEEMLRLCCRYLQSDDLAREALNLAFLKVFQHIHTFNAEKGEVGAWIRTIMLRTSIDLARTEARFSGSLAYDPEDDFFIEPEALRSLYAADLVKSIRQLPSASQLVFNLYVVDGYTHKEIAAQLNISESTSRWHLSEAKKQLRLLLLPQQDRQEKPTERRTEK